MVVIYDVVFGLLLYFNDNEWSVSPSDYQHGFTLDRVDVGRNMQVMLYAVTLLQDLLRYQASSIAALGTSKLPEQKNV